MKDVSARMRVGVISMDEHAAGWSSAALTKVPKRNRQSERIATLRERGYSEQELAETQRLDRHNLLLVLLTLAALLEGVVDPDALVLVVDNGSADGTTEVARDAGATVLAAACDPDIFSTTNVNFRF